MLHIFTLYIGFMCILHLFALYIGGIRICPAESVPYLRVRVLLYTCMCRIMCRIHICVVFKV